jgi:hypothetical protein
LSVEWKMPAIVAAAAFVLALIVGIFAGAQFWVLILRSLLTGAGSGLCAFGLRWLALRFLPGIGSDEAVEAAEGETGRNVDLKVGDAGESEESAETVLEGSPRGGEERGDEGFTEELEELKASPILGDGEGEGGESTYASVSPPDAIGDVDVLPDLDVFTDAFVPPSLEGSPDAPIDSAPGPSGSRRSKEAARAGLDDPDIAAQAVRTLLSRERKG